MITHLLDAIFKLQHSGSFETSRERPVIPPEHGLQCFSDANMCLRILLTTLFVASSHAFVAAPLVRAQPLGARPGAPRTGQVAAIYNPFGPDKFMRARCVLPPWHASGLSTAGPGSVRYPPSHSIMANSPHVPLFTPPPTPPLPATLLNVRPCCPILVSTGALSWKSSKERQSRSGTFGWRTNSASCASS